jgi:ribonuclease T1
VIIGDISNLPILREEDLFKMKNWKKLLAISLTIFLLITFIGCKSTETESPVDTPIARISAENSETNESQENQESNEATSSIEVKVKKGLRYSTKEEVAAYIHKFKELPPNFITKKEAQELGWNDSEGNLWDVTARKSIGGDRFYNREGFLPEADNRQYYECDINYYGGYRGAERIVYSNDGLIFYTDDHYESFERLF